MTNITTQTESADTSADETRGEAAAAERDGAACRLPAGPAAAGDGAHATERSEAAEERLSKMARLREEGRQPFAHIDLSERADAAAILAAHDPKQLSHGEHPQLPYTVAGRIVAARGHGRKAFIDLRDRSGEIQLYAAADTLGDAAYDELLDLDIGDIISVSGCLYVTQRRQLALSVRQSTLLTKSLRTPPDRHKGVTNAGTRHRWRELDLMANEDARELFRMRARTIEALRAFMASKGFIEVETPVLQSLAGGASARPFQTHHNALDTDLSLRISVELYLNRCLIGGIENVYDLGKCFRNEGISYRHSPEFTMLEWLQSYANHADVARFTEEMVSYVATEVLGGTVVERDGRSLDLCKWRRTTMREEIERVLGIDMLSSDAETLVGVLREHREHIDPDATWAQAVHVIYSKLIEHTLIEPTLVFGFPIELFPITKRDSEEPRLAEHFDAVIGGIELVSGDSEVTDPIEQRKRFVEQREARGEEAEEAHPHDEDYVRSLEYGLAPSASGGMGVDRLLMILTGKETLREVLPFPTLKEQR